MDKKYQYVGEDSDVISGSLKEGNWTDRIVATLVEPSGTKQIHWNFDAVAEAIGKDYAKTGKTFCLKSFKSSWDVFVAEGEKAKAKRL